MGKGRITNVVLNDLVIVIPPAIFTVFVLFKYSSLEREGEAENLLNQEDELLEILNSCILTGQQQQGHSPLKQRVNTFPLNNM